MEIPKSYKLLGHTINIEIDNKDCIKEECLGKYQHDINKITLASKSLINNLKVELPKSQLEHSFLHESVHAILKTMNEEELNGNEKFVDTFAGLLHQMLTTQKY